MPKVSATAARETSRLLKSSSQPGQVLAALSARSFRNRASSIIKIWASGLVHLQKSTWDRNSRKSAPTGRTKVPSPASSGSTQYTASSPGRRTKWVPLLPQPMTSAFSGVQKYRTGSAPVSGSSSSMEKSRGRLKKVWMSLRVDIKLFLSGRKGQLGDPAPAGGMVPCRDAPPIFFSVLRKRKRAVHGPKEKAAWTRSGAVALRATGVGVPVPAPIWACLRAR